MRMKYAMRSDNVVDAGDHTDLTDQVEVPVNRPARRVLPGQFGRPVVQPTGVGICQQISAIAMPTETLRRTHHEANTEQG